MIEVGWAIGQVTVVEISAPFTSSLGSPSVKKEWPMADELEQARVSI
jgi:hypothetical protein